MNAAPAPARATRSAFEELGAQILLDAMPAAAVVLDAQGALIAYNERAEDLLPGHPSALLGKSIDGPFRMIVERARRAGTPETPVHFEQALGSAWYQASV